jgi:hypothetical protein
MTRLQAEALKYAVKRIDPGQHTLTWEYLQQYCEDRVRSVRNLAQRRVFERSSNDDKLVRVIIPAVGGGRTSDHEKTKVLNPAGRSG